VLLLEAVTPINLANQKESKWQVPTQYYTNYPSKDSLI
jgi:hypothetical protein